MKKKTRKTKAKTKAKTRAKKKVVKVTRHPKRPPVRKLGNRIDFTKVKTVDCEPGSILEEYNKLPTAKCPSCKRKGKKNIWKNGDVFFTHRLMIKEGRPRTTDFCYVGGSNGH